MGQTHVRLPMCIAVLLAGIAVAVLCHPSRSFAEETLPGIPEISISISFPPDGARVDGRTVITFRSGGDTTIRTGTLEMRSVRYNGAPFKPAQKGESFPLKAGKGSVLEIEYSCPVSGDGPCISGEKGIFLSGDWYPSPGGLGYHRLAAEVPEGLSAVSEAEEFTVEKKPGGSLYTFSFPHPVERLHFVAARFVEKKETFRGIEISTRFFSEDTGLADTYLEYTKKYLELYEEIAGSFPFRRFSVVENFLPTGYSMPTFTLLGQDVVRLPFIVRTSLGHEILHQWLGNSVYADYESGNWSEALTTYLSDHLYEEKQGRGWQYRKQVLVDYESYVGPDNEFPLRDFRTRTDLASGAIGYGKGAMVFHMLRKLIGDEAFAKALRDLAVRYRFRKASWDDLQAVFEAASGKQLGQFFGEWLKEKGFPSIEVKEPVIGPEGLRYSLSLDVLRTGTPYLFDLPLRIVTDRGDAGQVLPVGDEKQTSSMVTDSVPRRLIVDESYDVFRKPSDKEIPPVIGKLLGNKGVLVLPPEERSAPYSAVVEYFKARGYAAKNPGEVSGEDLAGANLVILDSTNPLLKRLFAGIQAPSAGFVLLVKKNPFNTAKVVAVASSSSPEEAEAAVGKIRHYGKYSLISFAEGKNTEKKIDESERGWVMPLRERITGIRVSDAMDLREIVADVAGKKIIYLGEQHDRYEHHVAQFEAIRELFTRNRRIAIGLEMFQRPFQRALDDYIAGRTDEREFLKASEYFKRWGFDYNLYKDILRFARQEGIPVVALNIRKEIVDKVSKQGIASLAEEEQKELPGSMDMADGDYRQRLKEVFDRHESSAGMDFANFYQSQILWDETMAESIDDYLKKEPDRQMVVLAGGGHLVFGSGIPKRAFRRNGLEYAVVLNDDSIEAKIADYILFPEQIKPVTAPRLMVILKKEDGKVKVAGFGENSVAEKAGIRKGDVIISLDDEKVGGVEDMQLFLFFKKRGDRVTVTVSRKRFLLGERELRFEVTL